VLFLLQVLSKVSVGEVFVHYFEKVSSASGGFAPDPNPPDPTEVLPLDPAGGLPSFRPPYLLPTPGKNPASAYEYVTCIAVI